MLNLADFLEAPVSSETAETIAHKCTFDNMKEALSEEHAITKHINMRKGILPNNIKFVFQILHID